MRLLLGGIESHDSAPIRHCACNVSYWGFRPKIIAQSLLYDWGIKIRFVVRIVDRRWRRSSHLMNTVVVERRPTFLAKVGCRDCLFEIFLHIEVIDLQCFFKLVAPEFGQIWPVLGLSSFGALELLGVCCHRYGGSTRAGKWQN